MIVCIHEVFTVDQMRDYLLLLFQSNTKLNKEEYILEVFTDWNEMNYQPNRKEELLKLFLELLETEMNDVKWDRIRNAVLHTNQPNQRKSKKRIRSCYVCSFVPFISYDTILYYNLFYYINTLK